MRGQRQHEREDADRREQDDPAHQDEHRVAQSAEEAEQRRAGAGLRAMASANSSVKRISGSIAPLAAAGDRIGRDQRGEPRANVSAAAAGGELARRFGRARRKRRPRGEVMWKEREESGGERNDERSDGGEQEQHRKTSSVRPPRRPMAFTSVADATPVMSSETTSGITVMRMAFTHSVPIGAMKSAAREKRRVPRRADDGAAGDRRAEGDEDARALFHHIIKSPPLISNDAPVM